MSINVFIADDHLIVREGIKTILNGSKKDIQVVAEANDGREVLKMADTEEYDILIIDITMPKLNGLETARRLIKKNPSCKIIILSMHDDRGSVERALSVGVKGYLLKECAVEEVVNAVEMVFSGKNYLSKPIEKYIQSTYRGRKHNYTKVNKSMELTDKEIEVLQLLAEGHTSNEIADQLGIAFNTVNVHRNNIMQKLDIHKAAELVRYAIKEGLVRI